MTAELPLSIEERITRLEKMVNPAWVNGMDLLAEEGYLGFGKPATVQITNNGIKIISATSPLDDSEKERYIEWVSKTIWGAVVGRLGVAYDAGIVTTEGTWLVELATDAQIEIGTASNIDTDAPTKRVTILVSDFVDAGSTGSGFFVQSRSTGDATQRDILTAQPHVTGGPGRVKVGYDAASTDDIISLVLDNADSISDLPTAVASIRGGLTLVEGSPDELYVCYSPDGGSSYAWAPLGDLVGGGMELIVKPTDQSVNGTTLTNETALAIPIGANETIQFEGVVFQTGSTWKLAVTGPSGSDGYFMQERPGQSASMNSLGNAITSLGANEPRYISGAVVNGATPGNITLQFAEQSAVGGTTMQAGSYIKWQKQ